MTDCTFQTSYEHSTSLGRARYQHCVCGRFRVLLDSDVLREGPSVALHANSFPHRAPDCRPRQPSRNRGIR